MITASPTDITLDDGFINYIGGSSHSQWWLRKYSQAIFIDNQEDSSRHFLFPPFSGVGGGINQDQGKSNLACHTRRGFTALQELWPQMSGGLYGQIFVLGVTHLGDKKGIQTAIVLRGGYNYNVYVHNICIIPSPGY